jgi:hypothetical protein
LKSVAITTSTKGTLPSTPHCFTTSMVAKCHKTQNATTNTTHITQHTQQPTNMSRCHPTPRGFALSLSVGRAAMPPNHHATAPQCHTQVPSHWACAQCCWFINLGGQNERHQKIQRGQCLGLRWPPFSSHDTTTNQMIVLEVGWALEIRRGRVRTCREDVFPLFGETNWDRKK